MHRDLKPDNILIKDGMLKIGDFGFGKKVIGDINKHKETSLKFTPYYGSPQLLEKKTYTYLCDIWSLGVMLFEMLVGHLPFDAPSIPALVAVIKKKLVFNPNQPLCPPTISLKT